MRVLILFLDRIINLYILFIVMACFLALIPNINPAYPLFHYIFMFAGFYLIPPIFGIVFAPVCMLCICTIISIGLRKLYDKYYNPKNHEVFYISAEQFAKHFNEINKIDDIEQEAELKKEEKNSDDTSSDL